MPLTLLVPRGAEDQAVRRAVPAAAVVTIAAGAASAALPPALAGATFAVVVGLCGSLRSARVGDVVLYEHVADAAGRVAIDAADLAIVQRALPNARTVGACTAGHVVTRAAERAALAAAFDADAVDMEGTFLARALRERGVRFAMVRVVSDDPRFDLPPIEHALGPDGTLRPLELARAFVRAPVAFARFVRDVQASLRVLGTTGAALAALDDALDASK